MLAVDSIKQRGAWGIGSSAVAVGKEKWLRIAMLGIRLLVTPRNTAVLAVLPAERQALGLDSIAVNTG